MVLSNLSRLYRLTDVRPPFQALLFEFVLRGAHFEVFPPILLLRVASDLWLSAVLLQVLLVC